MTSRRVGNRFSKEARQEAASRRRQGRGAWPKLKRRRNPRGKKSSKNV